MRVCSSPGATGASEAPQWAHKQVTAEITRQDKGLKRIIADHAAYTEKEQTYLEACTAARAAKQPAVTEATEKARGIISGPIAQLKTNAGHEGLFPQTTLLRAANWAREDARQNLVYDDSKPAIEAAAKELDTLAEKEKAHETATQELTAAQEAAEAVHAEVKIQILKVTTTATLTTTDIQDLETQDHDDARATIALRAKADSGAQEFTATEVEAAIRGLRLINPFPQKGGSPLRQKGRFAEIITSLETQLPKLQELESDQSPVTLAEAAAAEAPAVTDAERKEAFAALVKAFDDAHEFAKGKIEAAQAEADAAAEAIEKPNGVQLPETAENNAKSLSERADKLDTHLPHARRTWIAGAFLTIVSAAGVGALALIHFRIAGKHLAHFEKLGPLLAKLEKAAEWTNGFGTAKVFGVAGIVPAISIGLYAGGLIAQNKVERNAWDKRAQAAGELYAAFQLKHIRNTGKAAELQSVIDHYEGSLDETDATLRLLQSQAAKA